MLAVEQYSQTAVPPTEAWPELQKINIPDEDGKKLRVRQHVNPLRVEFQSKLVIDRTEWPSIFADPSRELFVDVGCGSGKFLLAMSQRLQQHNLLGLDIRGALLQRANTWAKTLGTDHRVHYLLANATISLASILEEYPGPLTFVAVQMPDPHFKTRHQKRRTVQPKLVQDVARLMAPGGQVFLQSDIEPVAAAMRDEFERGGKGAFALAPQHHESGTSGDPDGAHGLRWKEAGWLPDNPLGVMTERESAVLRKGGDVYRVLLQRTSLPS
ncbi:hypothetical protein WJX72_003658 [[Myrmecia] bisecta]|uniref:tRNA (guanine(46)-N(7))-methyltransferase n=1 Tax=[Myrmecia] bisecta TaxID=41462 RepID=A0AAW1QER8_9CHLO